MTYPGYFLVFEGGDGVGKSTQVALLAEWLRSEEGGARSVLETREPGGTPLGAELRSLLMHGDPVSPRAEALLYAADRAENVALVIRPALERGDIVIQDRYLDSSIVYQGMARGLGAGVEGISMWAVDGLLPDLTVVLDMAPDPSRLGPKLDRLERELAESADIVRGGFVEHSLLAPGRYAVIDAARPPEVVHADIRVAVAAALAGQEEA